MCSCARRSVELWRHVKDMRHLLRRLNPGTRWSWRLRWRPRPLHFHVKNLRSKLNREVGSTKAEINPSEKKRNISWTSTELEVDWSIAQPLARSVYGLDNRSFNETYGQTKINRVVMVSFDIIFREEVEMKLDSYNSTYTA